MRGLFHVIILSFMVIDFVHRVLCTEANSASPSKQKKYVADSPRRPLTVGDTFTPPEMLPIAKKLMSKIVDPGHGKGIVSSARTPEMLAEDLFGNFFATSNRIVVLQAYGLSGLDALQALALSGDNADDDAAIEKLLAHKAVTVGYKDHIVEVQKGPMKCQYMLISKPVHQGNSRRDRTNQNVGQNKSNVEDRRALEIAKNLAKKRRLSIKLSRRRPHKGTRLQKAKPKTNVRNKINKKTNKKVVRTNGKLAVTGRKTKHHSMQKGRSEQKAPITNKDLKTNANKTGILRSNCRWVYKCDENNDLDSCRLHTECLKDSMDPDEFSTPHIEDEHSEAVKTFRKMTGITLWDEEVEKIIERRVLNLGAMSTNRKTAHRMEGLSEYFDRIIRSQNFHPIWKPICVFSVCTASMKPSGSVTPSTMLHDKIPLRKNAEGDHLENGDYVPRKQQEDERAEKSTHAVGKVPKVQKNWYTGSLPTTTLFGE